MKRFVTTTSLVAALVAGGIALAGPAMAYEPTMPGHSVGQTAYTQGSYGTVEQWSWNGSSWSFVRNLGRMTSPR